MKNKIGSVVNYNGYDWIVIKEGDDITLMMKDCLSEDEIKELFENDDIDDDDHYCVVFNHDQSNNDWCSSHIRTVLNGKFLDKFNKSDLNLMKTNYDEDKYSNDYIRIPTLREIERFDKDILNDKEFNYISLSRREIKILFNIYQNATSEISYLDQKNEQLESNWKELKKWLEEQLKRYQKRLASATTELEDKLNYERCHICRNTLDKMEELESGNNE